MDLPYLIVGVVLVALVCTFTLQGSKVSSGNALSGRLHHFDKAQYDACTAALGADCLAKAWKVSDGTETPEQKATQVIIMGFQHRGMTKEMDQMRLLLDDLAELQGQFKAYKANQFDQTIETAMKATLKAKTTRALEASRSGSRDLQSMGYLLRRLYHNFSDGFRDCSQNDCNTCIFGCSTGDCCVCNNTPFGSCDCSGCSDICCSEGPGGCGNAQNADCVLLQGISGIAGLPGACDVSEGAAEALVESILPLAAPVIGNGFDTLCAYVGGQKPGGLPAWIDSVVGCNC